MDSSRCLSRDSLATEGSLLRTTLSPHSLVNGNCRHLTIYMLFCSFLQRFRPNMRKSAQCSTESFLEHCKGLIHTPTSLLYVANNRCFEICPLTENQWQENLPARQKIRISSLHSQQQRILCPDSLSYMASAAFPSDKGFWAQLHCPPCYERDQGVNTFCAQFFVKQGFTSKKSHISASKHCNLEHKSWCCDTSACRCWNWAQPNLALK